MSDTTFRTPVESTETPAPKADVSNSAVSSKTNDDLLATYAEEHKKPYVAKYYNLDDYADEPEYKQELDTIEGFLKERVSSKKLDNSTKAADKYLKEIEKKAGLTGYENANERIRKLLAYVDFIKVIES